MEGKKNDSEKIRLELIPTEVIWSLGKVLTFGAKKYDDRNWEKGIAWSRVYGALQRHLNAWWGGESKDEETGFSHLWHALCCIVFLVTYEIRGVGKDDRPSSDYRERALTQIKKGISVEDTKLDRDLMSSHWRKGL